MKLCELKTAKSINHNGYSLGYKRPAIDQIHEIIERIGQMTLSKRNRGNEKERKERERKREKQ